MPLSKLVRYIPSGLAFLAIFLVPQISFAAELSGFFGPIWAPGGACDCPGTAPSWGCIIQVLQVVVNIGISVGIVICVLWLAWAGALFMMSGASPGLREQGKTRISNALVGLMVILAAWLIVDFVMKALYDPDTAFSGASFGPWNSIIASNGNDICIEAQETNHLTTGSVDFVVGSGGSSPGAQYGGGGGSCSIAASGACSIATLSATCFGRRAAEASKICNVESAGGQPGIPSGSDKLNGGSGPSYSIGLWQINLTTSQVGGLNCPTAFTRPCQGDALIKSRPGACNSAIKDQDLYNKCVAAAKNPAHNTAEACKLFNSRGFQPWSYTAKVKCNIPY